MALATCAGERPAVRTVVLRGCEANQRELYCYTDRRSAKVAELAEQPSAQLMTYDPDPCVQLRASGDVDLIDQGPKWQAAWEALSALQRTDYARSHFDPSAMDSQRPSESANPARNFLLLRLLVSELDVLHLHPERPLRVQASWHPEGWRARWARP